MTRHLQGFPGIALLAGGMILLSPTPSRAGILFSNFGPGLTFDLNQGNAVGNAFDGNTYAEGDTFTSPTTAPLQSVTIALSCVATCPATDPVTVALTFDNGDQPGAVLESFTIPGTDLGIFGQPAPPIELKSVTTPTLTAGTQYWVTVATTLNDSIAWNLNLTGDSADHAISTDGGATWFSPSGNTPGAFEVDSAIPEPASAALLVTGIGLLLVSRKLRQGNSPHHSATEPSS
jgi:hypothetical protein